MDVDLVAWMRTEAPDRTVYLNPPLVLALCQVRFTAKFGLDDLVGEFQSSVEPQYPNPERLLNAAQVQIGSGTNTVNFQSPNPTVLWKFTDDSGNWTVSLTEEFLTLETRRYEDFDEFAGRLDRVLDSLATTIRPVKIRRIGLRYINEIRSTNISWFEAMRKEMLGPLVLKAFQTNVRQSMQIVSLQAGDALINLHHGYSAEGSTVVPKPGEETPGGPFYLLDIDMYQQFDSAMAPPVKKEAIAKYVQEFHATVSDIFRWSTSGKYRSTLETA